jgi:hypothetical protein
VVDRRKLSYEELTDAEFLAIAAGGLERKEEETKVLLLPPGPQFTR